MTLAIAPATTRNRRQAVASLARLAAANPNRIKVPLEDVERRVLRACKTVRALGDRERSWLARQAVWPFATIDTWDDKLAQADNYAELRALEAERAVRFRPTPADHSDLHTALEWFNSLSLEPKLRRQMIVSGRQPFGPEQRVIWLRSLDWSFIEIGKRLGGISDDTARTRYVDALKLAWWSANK